MPTQIQSWLADFDQDDEELTEEYPAALRTRVFYVLDAAPHTAGVPQLRIDPMTVTLRQDNSPGTIKRYAPHQIQTPAKYLRPSDLIILPRLSRRAAYGGPQGDDDPLDTLRRILATGRARWGSAEGPMLTEGAGTAGPDHLDHAAGCLAASHPGAGRRSDRGAHSRPLVYRSRPRA